MRSRYATLAVLSALAFLSLNQAMRSSRAQAQSGVIQRVNLYAQPASTVSTDICTPFHVTQPCALRITATLAVTGPLYVHESNGTTAVFEALNAGSNLTAYQASTFTIGAAPVDSAGNTITYAFQLGTSTNGSVPRLIVDEVDGGTD